MNSINEANQEKQVGALEVLKEQATSLPHHPGVYIMRDEAKQVIYVGKAKDLRARVKTYFLGGDGRAQIEFLLRRIATLETIVTESENQAFVLERDLIAKYKPRYNIRLKDDKAYLSIRIDKSQPWPRLELVRKVENDGARYFGPYTFSYELRSLLDIVKRVVPLRTCTDTVFYNRQRPCLEYQIKRCAGPCCLPVERHQYMDWIKQAISILEGKTGTLIKELTKEMEAAANDLDFENAALLRDRIAILESAKLGQSCISSGGEDRDCFNIYREEGLLALSVLRVRFGHVSDNVNYGFSQVGVSNEEIIESAIEQFYDSGRDIPEEIIVPQELSNASILEEALSKKRGLVCHINVPQKGIKQRLLGLAELNARQYFEGKFNAESRNVEISRQMARLFGLKQVPRRVECIDISNLQGSDIVGAIVVFYDGEPDKRSYRKYTISFQDKPDDFAAMHEVVARRLKRGAETGDLPDLIIIDGGPGQLAKAVAARDELGINLEIISLAKERVSFRGKKGTAGSPVKPERVYLERPGDPIVLEPTDTVTHFMQRIRDEAHRFVITFHRQKRGKRVLSSVLDNISGLGPERRLRLFKAFGSIAKIREASSEEIAKAGRMPQSIAEKVKAAVC